MATIPTTTTEFAAYAKDLAKLRQRLAEIHAIAEELKAAEKRSRQIRRRSDEAFRRLKAGRLRSAGSI
jgi:hypothetical protein